MFDSPYRDTDHYLEGPAIPAMRRDFVQETAVFESFDGTRIVYDRVGDGDLPVVLCNGLGGDTEAWTPLLRYLQHKCRFYCLDHRGLFRSESAPRSGSYRIADHAEDVEYLLRDLGIQQAVFLGWSMGCAVSLELFRRHPHRVMAFVFLNGASQIELSNVLPLPHTRLIQLEDFLVPLARMSGKISAKMVERENFMSWLVRLGLVDGHVDMGIASRVMSRFAHSDPTAILRTTLEILNYSAKDLVPRINVPAKVITGERDRLVPPWVSRRLASSLPNASLVVVPRATHYALLEFPDIVSLHIEAFLEEQGLIPSL